jgi:hypothetical protein
MELADLVSPNSSAAGVIELGPVRFVEARLPDGAQLLC